jgi:hypothetical protein
MFGVFVHQLIEYYIVFKNCTRIKKDKFV